MAVPTLQTSFNSGELSPYMRGRTDLQVYANGCKELTNFLPLPQGGIMARTGTKFLDDTSLTSGNVRMIEFAPNSTVSYVLLLSDSQIDIYKNGTAAPVQTIATSPYLDAEVLDVDVEYQVDVLYMTHENHEPQVLTYTGSDTFTLESLFDQDGFEAPPFQKEDTSGTELVLSDEIYYVKLTTDTLTDITAAVDANGDSIGDLSGLDYSNDYYIELKIKNNWSLYQILGTNSTPSTPQPNATTGVFYAKPITAVVEDLAPTAQLLHLDNTYGDPHPEAPAYELRSDTLVWNFDLEGAFVRFNNDFPSDKILGTPATALGKVYWVQLENYLGQEEFATEYLTGSQSTANFDQGEVYKLLNPDGFKFDNAAPLPADGNTTANGIFRDDATTPPDWKYAFRYQSTDDTFAATNHYRVVFGSTGGASTVIANLSTRQTFDVMKTTNVLSVVSAVGNVTFDEAAEVHTANLTASKDFFAFGGSSGVEEDQYLMIKYDKSWVTVKVGIPISTLKAPVTVLNVIPTEKNKSELVDNGRSSIFRVSAWKAGSYPFSVALHEQRLVFGGSPDFPETVWFSKSTNNYDFRTIEYEGEVLDTTGITYNLGGRAYNRIRSMTSGPTLIIATEGAEWQLRPNNFGEALTPTNIRLSQETYIGSTLGAIRAGSSIFLVDRSGRFFREMQYDYQIDSFKSVDLNVLAEHLFRNDKVVDYVYQQTPRSVFWLVTEGGLLYSLTYEKERDVYSWARHRTDSEDSIKAVAIFRRTNATPQDKLAMVVERNGAYLMEEMTVDFTDDGSDNYKPNMWQLDSAVRLPATEGTYHATAKTITGISAGKPGIITSVGHGFLDGDLVRITGSGVPVLDDRVITVKAPFTDSFLAYDVDGVTPVDCRDGTQRIVTEDTVDNGDGTWTFVLDGLYFLVGDKITCNVVTPDVIGALHEVTVLSATFTGPSRAEIVVDEPPYSVSTYTAGVGVLQLVSYTDAWVSGGTIEQLEAVVSGLDHLNGKTVSVIIDGAYVGDTVVSGGSINTATVFGKYSSKYILVGLPYTPLVTTMPNALSVPDRGSYYGKRSRVAKLGMYLYDTIGLTYGQEGDEGQSINFRETVDPMDQSPQLFTGFKNDFTVDSSFDLAKEIFITQTQPYPITVLALIPELAS
jgi:hypothetical protein